MDRLGKFMIKMSVFILLYGWSFICFLITMNGIINLISIVFSIVFIIQSIIIIYIMIITEKYSREQDRKYKNSPAYNHMEKQLADSKLCSRIIGFQIKEDKEKWK